VLDCHLPPQIKIECCDKSVLLNLVDAGQRAAFGPDSVRRDIRQFRGEAAGNLTATICVIIPQGPTCLTYADEPGHM
jgi:hypothetical protein